MNRIRLTFTFVYTALLLNILINSVSGIFMNPGTGTPYVHEPPDEDLLEQAAFILEGEVIGIMPYTNIDNNFSTKSYNYWFGKGEALLAQISVHNIRPGRNNKFKQYGGYAKFYSRFENISDWSYIEVYFFKPERDLCRDKSKGDSCSSELADFQIGEIVRAYLIPHAPQLPEDKYLMVWFNSYGKIALSEPPSNVSAKKKWALPIAIVVLLFIALFIFLVYKRIRQ